MEEKEANNLMALLEIVEDDDGLIKYMGKSMLNSTEQTLNIDGFILIDEVYHQIHG